MANPENTIPEGLCQCGCGEKAPISPYTDKTRGYFSGQPRKYISGHNFRGGKKGEKCNNWKGGRRPQKGGYVRVYSPNHPRKDVDGYVKEHLLLAEKAFGKPLPARAIVHHHSPEQLVICENQAYHLYLHQRMRAYKACGHADWRKCWICKQYDSPENLNIVKNGKAVIISHKKCRSNYYFKLKNRK